MESEKGKAEHDSTVGPSKGTAQTQARPYWQRARPGLTMLGLYVLSFGLIFAGWGFRDFRGFFAHPVRLAFVVCTAAVAVIVLTWMRDVQSFRKGPETVGNWLSAAWMVMGLLAMFFLPFADRRTLLVIQADSWRYVGFALFLAGAIVRLVAAQTLGRQFSGLVTVQDDHRLVQTGIYGVIRHPMYLGLLMSMPGFALVFRSWLALPLFVVCVVVVFLRMRQEEHLLRRYFGEEFDTYRRRTRRLIPFLY
jgi:protein-S-isoprenylcysteine O-methyltransferase Ste14